MNLATSEDLDELDPRDVPNVGRDAGEPSAEPPASRVPTEAPKPRPRAVPMLRPVDPSVPLSNFGGVPQGVTHWRCRRRVLGGGWEGLSHGEPGTITAIRQWPLAELSEAKILERWGAGRYQVQWVRPTPGGGSNILRGGQEVDIGPIAAPAAPSAEAPSPTSFGPEVDRTLQMMRMISTEADAKMTSVLQFAAALAGANRQSGPSAAEMELMAIRNRDAMVAAVAAAVAPLQAELAAVRRELDAEEEDDGPGFAEAAGAAAAAVGLMKGKGWWVAPLNLAATHPELVKSVALPVASVFAETALKIAAMFRDKPAAAPRPVATPIQQQIAPTPAPCEGCAATRAGRQSVCMVHPDVRAEWSGPRVVPPARPTIPTVPVSSGDRAEGPKVADVATPSVPVAGELAAVPDLV